MATEQPGDQTFLISSHSSAADSSLWNCRVSARSRSFEELDEVFDRRGPSVDGTDLLGRSHPVP